MKRLSRRAMIGAAASSASVSLLGSMGVGATTNGGNMTSIRYKFVQVGDLRIFYREAGAAEAPPVLLLHGFPSSSRMYEGLLEKLGGRYRLIAPDFPAFGHSDAPSVQHFQYTFENVSRVMENFCDALHLDSFNIFMQDYGAPVGMRMIVRRPERIKKIIIQNGNLYDEGLGPTWDARRAFWRDRAANESALRANLLSLEATRKRHLGSDPNPEFYNPDSWTDEFAFLSSPGQAEIQTELFYDYRTNVALYPDWQAWLRQHQPTALILWGRYDLSFTEAGGKAFRRDLPKADIHMLDAGHFAMDTRLQKVADLTSSFLE